jgi:hypothetical protein
MTKSRSLSNNALPRFIAAVVAAFGVGSAFAQQPQPRDPLRFEFDGGFVKFGVEAGAQGVVESRAFWNLARALDPASRYRTNQRWGEFYLKPSLNFEARLGSVFMLYGGLSAVGARTQGRDIYDQRHQGRLLLENGYLGIRHGTPGAGFFFDLSAGPQPYRVGSGMLISDGSADGFERGAVIFGPRQAWAMTAIAKAGYGPLSVEGFYLDPNELQSGDTATRLAGGKIEWSLGQNQFIGMAYGEVLQSTAPYAQAAATTLAAPAIINGARDGLRFVNAYARFNPLQEALPGLWIAGDLAIQRNSRIKMSAWGARAEIGYAFSNLPWRPTLAYAYQTFSGDKPNTTGKLERFDPLFYDGGQAAWATGTNGSFVFINSNVNAHRLSVALTITPQDLLTLRYAHVRANELFSPIQFGQGTRLVAGSGGPALISGVSKNHLSDDFLVEYTRVLSPNAFLTFGMGYSIPGAGLRAAARPQRLNDWAGGFANLVIRY